VRAYCSCRSACGLPLRSLFPRALQKTSSPPLSPSPPWQGLRCFLSPYSAASFALCAFPYLFFSARSYPLFLSFRYHRAVTVLRAAASTDSFSILLGFSFTFVPRSMWSATDPRATLSPTFVGLLFLQGLLRSREPICL